MRLVKTIAALALVGATFADEPKMAGTKEGLLEIHSVPIQRMFRLSWRGEALVLDRSIWKEAEKDKDLSDPVRLRRGTLRFLEGGTRGLGLVFQDLSERVGSSFCGGQGGRGPTASASFKGKGLEGDLRVREQETVNVLLRETSPPGRMIELFDDGQGALRVVFTDADAKNVIFYNQAGDGRFNLGLLGEGRAEALSGTALGTLCRERPELGSGVLFPLLNRLGIESSLSPSHPDVIRAVCAALRTPTEQGQSEGETLLRQLDHDEPAKREEATRLLSERYFVLKELIRKAADNSSTSTEARERLRLILVENANAVQVDRFVAATGMLKDPSMLAQMLPKVSGLEREHVAKAIETLGGKDATRTATSRSRAGSSLPPLPEGMFQKVSEHIGRMISLAFKKGMLCLDRDHWDAPYSGKSEAELKEIMRQQVASRYYRKKVGSQLEDKIDRETEDLLKAKVVGHFDRLNGAFPRSGGGSGGPPSQCNMHFYGGGLDANLINRSAHDFIHLAFREESAPHRVLDCHDDGSGRLRLYTASPELDGDAFLFQGPDGRFVLFAFRGGKPRALAGLRIQEFYEKTREWMDPEFFDVLRHMGVLTPKREDTAR